MASTRTRIALVAALAASALAVTAGSSGAQEAAVDGITMAAVDAEPAGRGGRYSVAVAPERVVFISDSALAGIRWNGQLSQLTNSNWETYLESCRRLSSRSSCRGREGYAPRTAYRELESILANRGPAGPFDMLVIGVGYNDWHSSFRTDFTAVNQQARRGGFNHIVWITLREDNTYVAPGSNGGEFSNYVIMNAIMREELATGAWPEVQLWEWDDFSDGQSSWFTPDGVHLTTTGAYHAARWFSEQILYVNTPRPELL